MPRFVELCVWANDQPPSPAEATTDRETLLLQRPLCSVPHVPCAFYRIGQSCCHAENRHGACPLIDSSNEAALAFSFRTPLA
jgi:hypothetical protein